VTDRPGESAGRATSPGSQSVYRWRDANVAMRPGALLSYATIACRFGPCSDCGVDQTKELTKFGKPVTTSVNVRIPAPMVTEAKERASRAGVSLTQLMSTALAKYLDTK
jgi:hypothetical protein